MKTNTLYVLVLLLGILFLTSCGFLLMDKRAKWLVKNEKGLLRGIDPDMTIAEVKKTETDSAHEQSPTFLAYYLPGKEKNEHVEVEYSFNEQGRLDLIMAYYHMEKDDDAESMINGLKKYYDRKLGPSKKDEKGWQEWEYKDTKGLPGTIEVVLNKSVGDSGKVVDLQIVKYYETDNGSTRTIKKGR